MSQDFQPITRRSTVKADRVLTDLRRQIVRGDLAPGAQLPFRTDLIRSFGVSGATIQRALDHLIHDGFVYTRLGQGTFVADRLPHIQHYGVVFPAYTPRLANPFYAAIADEIDRSARSRAPRRFSVYCGLSDLHAPDRHRLRDDLRRNRLAGLLYACPPQTIPELFRDLPEEAAAIPAVAITSSAPDLATPAAYPDLESFYRRAFERFAALGKTRVAIIAPTREGGSTHDEIIRRLQPFAASIGLTIKPHWVQFVSPLPTGIRNTASLLTGPWQTDRPDGLLIADDQVLEHTIAGLVDAQAVIGTGGLHLIAHCNFPNSLITALPLTRLGFDIRTLVATCIELLERRYQNLPVPGFTRADAVFENEVEPAHTPSMAIAPQPRSMYDAS